MSSAPGTVIMITRPYSRSSIGPRNCAPFRPQLLHRCIDVIAHDRNRVLTRVIISFAFPDAVRRVHAHLAWSRFENEPVVIPIFGHILLAEHVPQNGARGKRCDMARSRGAVSAGTREANARVAWASSE